MSGDKKELSIVNSSNGYSKITTFCLKSLRKLLKEQEEIKKSEEEAEKEE